jgi:hypothetical protein
MRLYRPTIPLSVKCEVAARQIMRGSPTVSFLTIPERPLWLRLQILLTKLASQIGCEIKELRLDHDPALGARSSGVRNGKSYYIPDANDPDHLFYRPHSAQHEGSHDIKTRVRGEHGQFSDIALIKRLRRRERGPKPKRAKIQSRGFDKKSRPFPKPVKR